MKHKTSIIVISQNVNYNKIKGIVNSLSKNSNSIIILSTHKLFEFEKNLFHSFNKLDIMFFTFADFLSPKEMDFIDEITFEKVLNSSFSSWDYARVYKKFLLYQVNQKVFQNISQRFNIDKVYFTAIPAESYNLGVSWKFWKEQRAKRIYSVQNKFLIKSIIESLKNFKFGYKLIRHFNQLIWLFQNHKLYVHNSAEKLFVFTSLKRIKFTSNFKPTLLEYRPVSYFKLFSRNTLDDLFKRFIHKKIPESLHIKLVVAVPIHQYFNLKKILYEPNFPIEVFEDAFRPPSLPHHYSGGIFAYGSFVVRDFFTQKYFQKANKQTIKSYYFIQKPEFIVNSNKGKIASKTIILSLNHGIDYSAFVNRSDTDILIEAFCKLPPQFPNKNFIIRLHPTMNRPEAEGVNSKSRVANLVKHLKLSNLSVSKVSLEMDWERGDIFISEFSLSALDAIRHGNLGLFVNLTDRKNFMDDFKKLGFPCVSSYEAMLETLKSMLVNSQKWHDLNLKAGNNYNKQLKDFYESAEYK
ncbi:MAG: hypothetical protein ACJAZ3_000173 [Sphingobacteriales bacterium]|jgi:hypothetical protein